MLKHFSGAQREFLQVRAEALGAGYSTRTCCQFSGDSPTKPPASQPAILTLAGTPGVGSSAVDAPLCAHGFWVVPGVRARVPPPPPGILEVISEIPRRRGASRPGEGEF